MVIDSDVGVKGLLTALQYVWWAPPLTLALVLSSKRREIGRLVQHLVRRVPRVELEWFEVASVPDYHVNEHEVLTRTLRGVRFRVVYDFLHRKAYLGLPAEHIHLLQAIEHAAAGLTLRSAQPHLEEYAGSPGYLLMGFPHRVQARRLEPYQHHVEKDDEPHALGELFKALAGRDAVLLLEAEPAGEGELREERRALEQRLAGIERLSEQKSYPGLLASREYYAKTTRAHELTMERRLANERLESLLDGEATSDAVHRVKLLCLGREAKTLKHYLQARFPSREVYLDAGTAARAFSEPGELLSGAYSARLVHFHPDYAEVKEAVRIPRLPPGALRGAVELGFELADSVLDSQRSVGFDRHAWNTHVAISGMQGMGKTTLAMQIALDSVNSKSGLIVLTPNKEWSGLGNHARVFVLPLGARRQPGAGSPPAPFNLVRCPARAGVEVYYQNLALLLSNSLGLGPYAEPFRNALLRTFMRLYTEERREPSLKEVTEAIRAGIREFYGGGSGEGKYKTNLEGALTELELLQLNENFTHPGGVPIETLAQNGVVFDTSEISDKARALVYAFILAQAWSWSNAAFDEHGDRKLRLLLVLEEAQLLFSRHGERDYFGDRETEAARELQMSLGHFRRKGVGLVFITHFHEQLSAGITRHAQNRFYFKQDHLGATNAARELGFTQGTPAFEAAVRRLAALGTRECAVRTIEPRDERKTVGPFFMKVKAARFGELSRGKQQYRTDLYLQHAPVKETPEVSPEKQKREESPGEAAARLAPILNERVDFLVIRSILRHLGEGAKTTTEIKVIQGVGRRYRALVELLAEQGLIEPVDGVPYRNAKPYRLTALGAALYARLEGKAPAVGKGRETWARLIAAIRKTYPKFEEGSAVIQLGNTAERLDVVLRSGRLWVVAEAETGTNNKDQLKVNLAKLSAKREQILGVDSQARVTLLWVAKNEEVKKRLESLTGSQKGVLVRTLHELEQASATKR